METKKSILALMKSYKLTSVWVVNEEETKYFSQDYLDEVVKAYVVEGDYGLSVKIRRKDSETNDQYVDYIPLSRESCFTLGDDVDLSKCKIICLQKKGEDDIYRLEEI